MDWVAEGASTANGRPVMSPGPDDRPRGASDDAVERYAQATRPAAPVVASFSARTEQIQPVGPIV